MKDLSLHILDIVQNSIRANARNVGISIAEQAGAGILVIEVSDDGSGMPQEVLERVTDPFYTSRTTR
ncbi:sensor histidine kinase, partial [Klebsiella quasipneumoniae]|uniref:sensor histidine kinase n=1 Tax=Klebsiella quasipneumoniae TaxID=1463165 RepID=UPI002731B264